MVALEAMERGRAVIASSVGGLPEIVAEGETGLLVPPGDPAALADAIRRLVADPRMPSMTRATAGIPAVPARGPAGEHDLAPFDDVETVGEIRHVVDIGFGDEDRLAEGADVHEAPER